MDLEKLAKEQEELAKIIIREDVSTSSYPIVIGVDVAYSEDLGAGVAIALDVIKKVVISSTAVVREIESDYIPGFFQLREGPFLIELLKTLKTSGTILVDGNGILHPRRFGLASYLGVKMNVQTIGVAKKLLLGTIGFRLGNSADIIHEDEIIGQVLWLKEKKPVYVSIGHKISLATAVTVVSNSSVDGYPEPLRRAHILSREVLREEMD